MKSQDIDVNETYGRMAELMFEGKLGKFKTALAMGAACIGPGCKPSAPQTTNEPKLIKRTGKPASPPEEGSWQQDLRDAMRLHRKGKQLEKDAPIPPPMTPLRGWQRQYHELDQDLRKHFTQSHGGEGPPQRPGLRLRRGKLPTGPLTDPKKIQGPPTRKK